jgi:fido (protein-threonine AMPylation protein)
MKFKYAPDATPLAPDEIPGLIPLHITTQEQLNEWEAANILQAENWALTIDHGNFLTIKFIQLLHKKMFDNTWQWAGSFRLSNKNIGIEFQKIRSELTNLLNDVIVQIENKSLKITLIQAGV